MASSKGSPGPHDRLSTNPRPTCSFQTLSGRKCRYPVGRGNKICNYHKRLLDRRAADPDARDTPLTPSDSVRGNLATNLTRSAKRIDRLARERAEAAALDAKRRPSSKSHHTSTSSFLINAQAKEALSKLGTPYDPTAPGAAGAGGPYGAGRTDPKHVLLDSVNSAWRQRQIWEAMLNAVPEEDWGQVGSLALPGVPSSARGARIEVIQKHLSDATKAAARISKLAIDAGIEERLVRLAEEQSALIADTVRAALTAAIASLVADGILTSVNQPVAIDLALSSAAGRLRLLAASGGPNGTGGLGVPGGGSIIEGIAREVEEAEVKRVRVR